MGWRLGGGLWDIMGCGVGAESLLVGKSQDWERTDGSVERDLYYTSIIPPNELNDKRKKMPLRDCSPSLEAC